MTDEQSEFFELFKSNKYKIDYYYRKFGKENVDAWIKSDWFVFKWTEWVAKQAKENELITDQWNNFKTSAYDIIAVALRGDNGAEAQLATAKWILSGEKSFIEARGKTLGEKSAEGNTGRAAPVIELIRKKTN